MKYANPRVLGMDEIVRVGEYRGVGVYAEAGRTEDPQVVFVPVRPGCVFQPYAVNVK